MLYDEAKQLAERYLNEELQPEIQFELMLDSEDEAENESSFLFGFNARRALTRRFSEAPASRDDDEMLIGLPPIFVSKLDGSLTMGTSAGSTQWNAENADEVFAARASRAEYDE